MGIDTHSQHTPGNAQHAHSTHSQEYPSHTPNLQQTNILHISNILRGITPTTYNILHIASIPKGITAQYLAHTRHRNPQGETSKIVKNTSVKGSKATANAREAREA